jgi:hypothetical protein
MTPPRSRQIHLSWRAVAPIFLTLTLIVATVAVFYLAGAGSNEGKGFTPASDGIPTFTVAQKQPWCGVTRKSDCPTPDPDWISVAGSAPDDIARAITNTVMYRAMQNEDAAQRLDTPVSIHTLAAPSGYDYYDDDHWVVTVRDGSNKQLGMLDAVYDRAHQRIRFAAYAVLRPSDPLYERPFPQMAADTALQCLQAARGLAAKQGTQPVLAFFPPDEQHFGPIASTNNTFWTAGGSSPLDPIWQVDATNGVPYFVGSNQHVYELKDLPIGKGS